MVLNSSSACSFNEYRSQNKLHVGFPKHPRPPPFNLLPAFPTKFRIAVHDHQKKIEDLLAQQGTSSVLVEAYSRDEINHIYVQAQVDDKAPTTSRMEWSSIAEKMFNLFDTQTQQNLQVELLDPRQLRCDDVVSDQAPNTVLSLYEKVRLRLRKCVDDHLGDGCNGFGLFMCVKTEFARVQHIKSRDEPRPVVGVLVNENSIANWSIAEQDLRLILQPEGLCHVYLPSRMRLLAGESRVMKPCLWSREDILCARDIWREDAKAIGAEDGKAVVKTDRTKYPCPCGAGSSIGTLQSKKGTGTATCFLTVESEEELVMGLTNWHVVLPDQPDGTAWFNSGDLSMASTRIDIQSPSRIDLFASILSKAEELAEDLQNLEQAGHSTSTFEDDPDSDTTELLRATKARGLSALMDFLAKQRNCSRGMIYAASGRKTECSNSTPTGTSCTDKGCNHPWLDWALWHDSQLDGQPNRLPDPLRVKRLQKYGDFEYDPPLDNIIRGIGKLRMCENVFKIGRSTDLTMGMVSVDCKDLRYTITNQGSKADIDHIEPPTEGPCAEDNVQVYWSRERFISSASKHPFSDLGDSGSPILDERANLVAMLHAEVEVLSQRYAVATCMDTVRKDIEKSLGTKVKLVGR